MNLGHFQQLLADYLPAQLQVVFENTNNIREREIEFERVYTAFKAYKNLDDSYILDLWQKELSVELSIRHAHEVLSEVKEQVSIDFILSHCEDEGIRLFIKEISN